MPRNRITVALVCAQCQGRFEHTMPQGGDPPKLCSHVCRLAWREAVIFAPRRLSRVCKMCGESYQATPGGLKRRVKVNFCSRDCVEAYANRPDDVRFWEKVNKDGPIPDYAPNLGPCWVWLGRPNAGGYAKFWEHVDGELKIVSGHIWAYLALIGPYDRSLDLDHLCRVRHCVNPRHLEPVTPAENARRGMAPAMIVHRTGICQRGHAQTADNVYITSRGGRHCKPCSLANMRRRQAALAALVTDAQCGAPARSGPCRVHVRQHGLRCYSHRQEGGG